MLRNFGPEIWIADGPDGVAVAGFRYSTRMAVIRLPGGGLFVWSPVELSDGLRAGIDALGPVRHVVAPNAFHHLFLADWKGAYPDAKVHAAPGLRKKRADIAFDTELVDIPNPDWAGTIDQVLFAGNVIVSEVVFFHAPSGTALFTDLIQQFPPGWFSGWREVVAKLDHMVGPEPAVPRKFRVTFINRSAAREAADRIFSWPTTKVVMAHGTPVDSDGAAFLRRAFEWLKG